VKKFQFPLERVRRFRKLQMETEQVKLEQLQAHLASIDSMEAELHRQKQQADQALVESPTVGTPELAVVDSFRAYTQRMANIFALRRAQVQEEILMQKENLLVARQKYEVLERLKSNRHAKWKYDLHREVEQLATEAYLARWNR